MNGSAALDHGFARFDHVRIPKSQMLSKFATVTEEGKYVPAPHAKLSYGGVSATRFYSCSCGSSADARAVADALYPVYVSRRALLCIP